MTVTVTSKFSQFRICIHENFIHKLILRLYVFLLSLLQEEQSGTFFHLTSSTSLILFFTTKRTGISQFRFSDSSFQLVFCELVLLRAWRGGKSRAELVKWGRGPPPDSCGWVYPYGFSLAIFSKSNKAENTLFSLAIYIFFGINNKAQNTLFLVFNWGKCNLKQRERY